MKITILTIFLIFFSTKAFSEKLFWKCYDDMLMSTMTNNIKSVEKMKFKNSNVYVDTDKEILKYWITSKDLVKEFSKGNQIKHDVFVDKILINDDMIVTTHKPYKEDYPNEYNIFNLDLKNIKLIKITSINKQRYTKYYDCKKIPLE